MSEQRTASYEAGQAPLYRSGVPAKAGRAVKRVIQSDRLYIIHGIVFRVIYHPEALKERESKKIPQRERVALLSAIDKLKVQGPALPFPHQSSVKGAGGGLRELRPRAGRSQWRALYARIRDDAFLVAAVAPEAQRNKRGFDQAVRKAQKRLMEVS